MSWRETREFLALLRGLLDVAPVTVETHDLGLDFAERYGLSIYEFDDRGGGGAERLRAAVVAGHAAWDADRGGATGGEPVPVSSGRAPTPAHASAPPPRRRARRRSAKSDIAQSMRKGVRNGAAPPLAAEAAATPKISTGIVSGRTSTAMSRPPRLKETVSAAPIAPIMVKAGVPAASVAATRASGFGAIASIRPKSGETTISGSALAVQCAAHLTSTTSSSGSDAVDHHVERAVVVVGLEEPVEPEQSREQRRDPQDRRAEAREQIEVGPERERHDRDEDQKEHCADRRPAADPPRDAPFANEEREGGGHANPSPLAGEGGRRSRPDEGSARVRRTVDKALAAPDPSPPAPLPQGERGAARRHFSLTRPPRPRRAAAPARP